MDRELLPHEEAIVGFLQSAPKPQSPKAIARAVPDAPQSIHSTLARLLNKRVITRPFIGGYTAAPLCDGRTLSQIYDEYLCIPWCQ